MDPTGGAHHTLRPSLPLVCQRIHLGRNVPVVEVCLPARFEPSHRGHQGVVTEGVGDVQLLPYTSDGVVEVPAQHGLGVSAVPQQRGRVVDEEAVARIERRRRTARRPEVRMLLSEILSGTEGRLAFVGRWRDGWDPCAGGACYQ